MNTVRVNVNPNVINWAIEITDVAMSYQQLATRYKWLNEDSKNHLNPTVKQLGDFSKKLHVPFAPLLMTEPPKQSDIRLAFRTQKNAPANVSLTVRDIIYEMQRKQAWYKEDSGLGLRRLDFIGSVNESTEEVTLQKLNSLISIKKFSSASELYKFIRMQLANHGVLNMQKGGAGLGNNRPLDVIEMRAFVLLDDYAPLIFINQKDSYTARIFSLVHEFIHLLRGSDELLQGSNHDWQEERLINHVTSSFLMPRKQFIEVISRKDIIGTARYFCVSPEAARIRAKQLKLIEKIEDIRLPEQPIPKKGKGGNPYNNALSYNDNRFMSVLVEAQYQGKVQPTKAASLMGISTKMLDETVKRFNDREDLI